MMLAPPDDPFAPEMFGPLRLRRIAPLLRRLPPAAVATSLAALAVADGIVRRRRFSLALEWARARGVTGAARWRLAAALVANHGRFVAAEMLIGIDGAEDVRRTTTVRGEDRLRAATGGALLLGFHLGPPHTAYFLRAFGFPVRPALGLEGTAGDPRWEQAIDAGHAVRLGGTASGGRTPALHRLLGMLRTGALVYLTADGPYGREVFRIDLPGRPLVLRGGWLALRRLAGVPTFPLLSFVKDGRRTIVVHEALPPPEVDLESDKELCRAALAPLIEDYVRRFPEQCRYLVFPGWTVDLASPRTRPPAPAGG